MGWRHEQGRLGLCLSAVEMLMYALSLAMVAAWALGCGPAPESTPPDLVTARGVKVYLHGHYPETLEHPEVWTEMDVWMDRFSSYEGKGTHPEVRECQSRLLVGVHTHQELMLLDRAAGGTDAWVEGFWDKWSWTTHVEAFDAGSPWFTTYAHEQLHMLHECWGWAVDSDHSLYPWQWAQIDSRPSQGKDDDKP